MGITHVVVRNDLDPATDAPDAAVVRASMADIPGARVAATFGRAAGGGPALEIFELALTHDPRVEVRDWSNRLVVSESSVSSTAPVCLITASALRRTPLRFSAAVRLLGISNRRPSDGRWRDPVLPWEAE